MPGLVPGIQLARAPERAASLDSGDKRRNDVSRSRDATSCVFRELVHAAVIWAISLSRHPYRGRDLSGATAPGPPWRLKDSCHWPAPGAQSSSRWQQHPLPHGLLVEQLVGGLRVVEPEAVRDKRRQRHLVLGYEAGAGILSGLAEGP